MATNQWVHRSAWWGVVCWVFLAGSSAYGATTAWNVSAGDWSVAGNWTNGEPTSVDNAYIYNNGTSTVSQVGEICTYLYCQTGVVRIVSGSLISSNETFGTTAGSYGMCVQSGGTNVVDWPSYGAYFFLGNSVGSTGVYILSDGLLAVMTNTGWGGEYIGGNNAGANAGYGHFIQTGGTNMTSLKLGYGGRGVYDLSNGYCQAAIGAPGYRAGQIFTNGVFNQTGGRFATTYGGIYIEGKYNLLGGEMYFAIAWDPINVSSNGTLNMGNTNGTGKIWGSSGWLAVDAGGTLRGWGTNSCGDRFTMNGWVIADGWSGTTVDRTLEMRSFADVRYTVKNTASNGWYAVNRGKLILPPLTIATGTTTQFWGGNVVTNNLVNSIGLIFTNVTVGGTITNALMALDRSDLPPPSAGVRYLIGAWQMIRPAALAFGSLTLSFRYDDTARAAKQIDPASLTIWHSTGGAWSPMSTTVNTTDKLATATITTLATTEYFALGSPWFAKGTVVMVQ